MKLFINANIPTTSAALKRVNVLFDKVIVKISKDTIETEEPVETIDLEGAILLPGAVDVHSHILNELDQYPAQIETVTKAALSGGWTTLAEMSYTADTPIFGARALNNLKSVYREHSYCDMAVWGHVDIDDYPYHSEAAQDLWAKGVVGLLLMNPSINPEISDISYTEIMDLFLDIYDSDTSFAYQGYDLEESKTYSSASQISAIKKILRRMQENPIHLPRIADFEIIEFINSISKRSDISFSLCIYDLMHLLSGTVRDCPLELKLSERLVDLLELFRTNKIYMLSNNLSSQLAEPDIPEIFSGTDPRLLKYSYLWVLSELWKKRKYSLHSCIKMTSENAAKRMGIYPQKGSIDIDSDADFVIYDPNQTTKTDIALEDGSLMELSGAIKSVWIRGEEVYNGKVQKQKGEFVHRTNSPKRRHNNTTWV